MAGSRWVWAENDPSRVPSNRQLPIVSSWSVSSTGRPPASTSAKVRPSTPMTCVFTVSSPRTHRLRYHSARPSRSRTPWTMPSPVNQW